MRKALLVTLLIVFSGSAPYAFGTAATGSGTWIMVAQNNDCGAGRVCAEWQEPAGAMDGAICCIQGSNMTSTSFGVCEVMLFGPRPDGDPVNNY